MIEMRHRSASVAALPIHESIRVSKLVMEEFNESYTTVRLSFSLVEPWDYVIYSPYASMAELAMGTLKEIIEGYA